MQHYDALYNLCNRFFDDDQEIITALNNGMLRVFKNIHQFDIAKAELFTWMYSIVRNEALTVVRNKKTTAITKELTADISSEISVNPFASSVADDVFIYLGKLSHTTRATCNLFYLEGYSIKEIAVSLDIKEGTVKWHLSEGRKKLQSIFNPTNQVVNAG